MSGDVKIWKYILDNEDLDENSLSEDIFILVSDDSITSDDDKDRKISIAKLGEKISKNSFELLSVHELQNIQGEDLEIISTGGSSIKINNLVMPSSDGTNGQIIFTDGSGNLGFKDLPRINYPISINDGGTGATTSSDARTNLNVYSKSEVDQKDSDVRSDIPSIPVSIAEGGTGADSISDARDNLDIYSKSEVDQKDSDIRSDIPSIPISITEGGTGGTTARTARSNLNVYSKDEVNAKIPEIIDPAYFETKLIEDTPFTGTLGLEDELEWEEVSGTDDFEFTVHSNFQYVKFLKAGKYKFSFTLEFGKANSDNSENLLTAELKKRGNPNTITPFEFFDLYFGSGDTDSRYFESQYIDVLENDEYQLILKVQPANANYLKGQISTFNIYEENHGGGSGNRVPTFTEVLRKSNSTGGIDISIENDNYLIYENRNILGISSGGATILGGDVIEIGSNSNTIILGASASRLSFGTSTTGYDIPLQKGDEGQSLRLNNTELEWYTPETGGNVPTLQEVLDQGNEIPLGTTITAGGRNFIQIYQSGIIDISTQGETLILGESSSNVNIGYSSAEVSLYGVTLNIGKSIRSRVVNIGYNNTEVSLYAGNLYMGYDPDDRYKMPSERGEIGQVLTQKANGITAWETPSGGGGNDPRFDLPISISQGGTASNTVQGARANLDVYSKSEVDGRTGIPALQGVINAGGSLYRGTVISGENGTKLINYISNINNIVLLGENLQAIYLRSDNLFVGRTDEISYTIPTEKGNIGQILKLNESSNLKWADESASHPSQGIQYNINTSDGLGGWEFSDIGINPDGDLVPRNNETQDLGAENFRFKDIHTKNLYVGGKETRPVYGFFQLSTNTPFAGTFGLEDELEWVSIDSTIDENGDKDFEFENHGEFQYIKFNTRGIYRLKAKLTIVKPITSNLKNTINCYLKIRQGNSQPIKVIGSDFHILTNDGKPLKRSFLYDYPYINMPEEILGDDIQIQLVMEVTPANSNFLERSTTLLFIERIIHQ